MRTLLLRSGGWLVGGLLLAAGCTAPAPPPAEFSREPLTGVTTVVLTVHGMSCPACAQNIDRRLMELKGVREATINLHSGEVTVQLEPGHALSPARFHETIEDSGFTLMAVRPERGTP